MSTIKDVAKLAGVSLGTVSNVLNSKTAVNPDKARRVQEAIESLNYKPSQSARSLKTSRTMNIAVVLPDILDSMKASLFTGIERVLSQQDYTVSLYTTSGVPAKETAIIERVLEQRADGLIISTCQPENTGLFNQLKDSDIAVVLVERDVADIDFQLVEFDNYTSIFQLTEKLLMKRKMKNVLITGLEHFSSERMCAKAFRTVYKEQKQEFVEADILRTGFNKENAFRTFTRYLQKNDIPDSVITTGVPMMNGVIKALEMQAVKKGNMPDLISLSEENWAESSTADYTRIARRPIKLGEAAAELLLTEIDSDRPSDIRSVKINNLEYKKKGQPLTLTGQRKSIKVLMLDSPACRAVKSLIHDYENRSGIKAEFTALDYDEMLCVVEDEDRRNDYDVLQLDIPWLPDLVQGGALLELKDYSEEVNKISEEFIPGVLSAYSKFNDGLYALPFMFGTQLLYYRKDLFEDTSLRLSFKEKYGFELGVPKTWAEFNLIAEFFTRSFNPGSPVEYGTTLGGKIASGAVCEYLPRLWGYEGSVFGSDGRINPDKTAFIKSIYNYKESFKFAHPDSSEYWWDEQLRDFKAGNAAMMIMFIAHAVDLADASDSAITGKIGYDIIPGGHPMLGGWSIGINSASTRVDESFSFINWAVSKELAIPQTILGGSTASISLYKSSELLTIYPWLPKALDSFKSSRKRDISKKTTAGKLSDRDFEIIIGQAVHAVITGEKSGEEAADDVWGKIKKIL